MIGAVANIKGPVDGIGKISELFDSAVSTLMNPLGAFMNPLIAAIGNEQKADMSDLKDLMGDMMAALHRAQEGPAKVDMGGKDTRPGDLTSQFDPKMDQDIHFYTGSGDERVMIM